MMNTFTQLFQNPHIHIRNPELLHKKLAHLTAQNTHVIADFDATLTAYYTHKEPKTRSAAAFDILEKNPFVSKQFAQKQNAKFEKFCNVICKSFMRKNQHLNN